VPISAAFVSSPLSAGSVVGAENAGHQQRTRAAAGLREVFRRWRSQPVGRVIAVINPILRGLRRSPEGDHLGSAEVAHPKNGCGDLNQERMEEQNPERYLMLARSDPPGRVPTRQVFASSARNTTDVQLLL
jgi:hypothetical protein